MSRCTNCKRHSVCKNPMQLGNGMKTARIMVVQESPYESENMRSKYMGGRAGKMFNAALGEVGIDVDDVYFTSLVKCSIPGDDLPTTEEVKACQEYLFAEIDVIDPEIIVPTGNLSMKALMGLTAITKHRGKVVLGEDNRKYLPILHPGMVLKQPKYLDMFSEDMITLGQVLNGGEVTSRPAMKKERRYCETYEDAVDEIKRLMALPAGSRLVIDLETTKANPFISEVTMSTRMRSQYPDSARNKICAIGFSDRAGYGSAIPLYHRQNRMSGNQIGTIIKFIRWLLERDDLEIVGQNNKFELKWLKWQLDIIVETMVWDIMLMHYLGVTEEKGTHGLDDFAWQYTDMGGYDAPLNKVKPTGEDEGNYDLIDWDILKVYLADDCDCTFRGFNVFEPIITQNEDFKWLWDNIMVPGYYTLHDIECTGIFVDTKWLEKVEQTYPVEIARIEEKLHQFPEVLEMEREWQSMWQERVRLGAIKKADRTKEEHENFEKWSKYNPAKGGCKFNFGSTQQLGELLFNRIGMTTEILTDKGNFSTNDDSLKSMRTQHPICAVLMEFRKVNHLYNNFIAGMRAYLDDRSIIHPSYNLHGTVTGRLSSADPNAQQFPRKCNDPMLFQYWNDIKKLFISRFGDDGIIVQYDYSQLELRILAVFSQDENLIELYRSGADLHKAIAALAFGVPIEQVTKDQRTASKKLQFGIVYQESPAGLSEDLAAEGIKMSVAECEKFIANYFKRFPRVQKWVDHIKKFAKRNKYVRTLTGRLRNLPAVDSVEKSIANEALRQAVNAPIQSTGSDCTMMSLIEINKWLKETGKRSVICITVHDSIVLDCPKDEVVEVSTKVKHIMENLAQYNSKYEFLGDVPIVSECEIGYSYGDSFELKDFEGTMSRISNEGVDVVLRELIAKKHEKELEEYAKAEKDGRTIPKYVEGYWNKEVA